jgi:beta-N-acetylhexosaminidase
MSKPLRRAVGSLLVVGLEGRELSALERAWLKTVRPGGVILFRRNIETAAQTRALLDQATALSAPHAFRAVDLEGGTVDRLREALAPTPSAQAVARAAKQTRKPSLIHEQGTLIAKAVQAFGFNTTLAPVLDLALPASAKVMGTRAAAPSAEEVVEYARTLLAAFRAQGIVGCGKHFPGLGAGTLDSHLETPAIDRSMRELRPADLLPYRELCHELPMVMISHEAYPRTPGKNKPASISKYWIERVLREEIGYRGIVFSDDLEMGGILNALPIEEAAIAAVRAGIDLLEICHSPELILRAYEALLSEAERSRAFRAMVESKAKKLATARRRLFKNGAAKPPTAAQFEALRTRMLRFAEKIGTLQSEETAPA